MIINVRFFALTREIAGQPALEHEMAQGTTLADFALWLYATYPAMESLRLRFAINRVYAPMETLLHTGDEIACIPPVGGG